jgi:hypothetical protein
MWDLSGTNSKELSKVLGTTGGPPGSRSQRLRIERGMLTVGFVRWGRNHRESENFCPMVSDSYGGVGMETGWNVGFLSEWHN